MISITRLSEIIWLHTDYGDAIATLASFPRSKRRDQRMRSQHIPDNLTHGACADTVNDVNLAQAAYGRFVKVVIQQRLNLLRSLSPQVKLERDPGLAHPPLYHGATLLYSAG